VQALFTTQELKNLVLKVRAEAKERKLKVLEELRYIFEDDLNIQAKSRATVQYLKNLGP
jgi:hypothetical protein